MKNNKKKSNICLFLHIKSNCKQNLSVKFNIVKTLGTYPGLNGLNLGLDVDVLGRRHVPVDFTAVGQVVVAVRVLHSL